MTPKTVAHQTPLPRQEYWRRLPFPSPGDLPNQGIEPGSPALAGRFFTDNYNLPLLVGLFLSYKFLLLAAFSFPLKEDPFLSFLYGWFNIDDFFF